MTSISAYGFSSCVMVGFDSGSAADFGFGASVAVAAGVVAVVVGSADDSWLGFVDSSIGVLCDDCFGLCGDGGGTMS